MPQSSRTSSVSNVAFLPLAVRKATFMPPGHGHSWRVLALAAVAFGVLSCGHPQPPAASHKASPLAATNWTTSTSYRCPSDDQQVQLDKVVYGDITGDGVADAVVSLTCSTTTSSNPLQIEAFDGASSPNHPRSLGVLFAADDPLYLEKATISITQGKISLDGWAIGPDAPLAAGPQVHVTQAFTYLNHAVTPGPRQTRK